MAEPDTPYAEGAYFLDTSASKIWYLNRLNLGNVQMRNGRSICPRLKLAAPVLGFQRNKNISSHIFISAFNSNRILGYRSAD